MFVPPPFFCVCVSLGFDPGRFHLAASKGLTECLTILLTNGADINSRNEDGESAASACPSTARLSVWLQRGPMLGSHRGSRWLSM